MPTHGWKATIKGLFLTLRELPAQVWIACGLHLLDSFAYFGISANLTIYLTAAFGVDDVTAGIYYGVWGALLVGFGIPCGFLIDRLGIKKSMIVGALFNSIARTIFALTDSVPVALTALFVGTTIGTGFFVSVLHIVVNRYTKTTQQSTVAFSMLYTCMNIGAIGAMLGTDIALRTTWYFEGYTLLFFSGAAVSIITLAVSLLYKDVEVESDNLFMKHPLTVKRCLSVLTEKPFWKLIGITVFLIGVRSMFRHWETLLPKWLTRVYPGISYGSVLALNPILIIPLTPIMGTLTQNFTFIYWILVIGAAISALAPLPSWLWITSSHAPILLSICIFTIGESLYSPKIGQIILERSPAGKKGIYSGLIPIPYFAGNIFSGLFSGWLLNTYCPVLEESSGNISEPDFDFQRAHECSQIWGWVILTAVTSPLLLIIFYKLLRTRESDLEKYSRLREAELETMHDNED